jgi:hypothetical protein
MITTLLNNTLAYTPVVSDKVTGSLFRNIDSGLNTPREVSVRHQDYVDSRTKKPGRRSVIRKDVHVELSDGSIAPVSVMIIAMVPKDVNVVADNVTDALSIARNMHSGHDGYTDIGMTIFVNGEQ